MQLFTSPPPTLLAREGQFSDPALPQNLLAGYLGHLHNTDYWNFKVGCIPRVQLSGQLSECKYKQDF